MKTSLFYAFVSHRVVNSRYGERSIPLMWLAFFNVIGINITIDDWSGPCSKIRRNIRKNCFRRFGRMRGKLKTMMRKRLGVVDSRKARFILKPSTSHLKQVKSAVVSFGSESATPSDPCHYDCHDPCPRIFAEMKVGWLILLRFLHRIVAPRKTPFRGSGAVIPNRDSTSTPGEKTGQYPIQIIPEVNIPPSPSGSVPNECLMVSLLGCSFLNKSLTSEG